MGYNQTYTYTGDGSTGQYGNMDCTANPAEVNCLAPVYYGSSNQINYVPINGVNISYSYDLAGDLINDGTYTYSWDAEGHLTKVVQSRTTISTQTYNALGQRVRDVTASATPDEAYGAGGSLLWRYTGSSSNASQRAFVPFNGRILAEYYGGSPGGTLFHHPDELGSDTVSTSYNGSICQEELFYPFGQFWTGAASCTMQPVFAQLPDYDPETNQYNTANRHYTPMGRWMSPDPGGFKVVSLSDPQTWNMYAYVRNNPTALTDPTGLLVNINCTQVSSDQCNQVVIDLNNRKDAAFQVTRADNGDLQVVNGDKVDVSKLSTSEAALFNAIQTDTTHTAELEVVPANDNIQFGRFEGAGLNKIDASDLQLLAGADPQAAGETVAHEALEAYHSLNADIAMDYKANHDWANQYNALAQRFFSRYMLFQSPLCRGCLFNALPECRPETSIAVSVPSSSGMPLQL